MLSEDDIKKFLVEKTKNSECPVCEDNDWYAFPSPTSNNVSVIPTIKAEQSDNQDIHDIKILQLTCNNCGFVRLHNINVMIEHIFKEKITK